MMAETGVDEVSHTGDASNKAETDSNENVFSTKTWRDDVALIVEDKPLYVNRCTLASASPVFDTMFSGGFKEKDQQEISLPGKEYGDFVEFLKCIYPGQMKPVNTENVFKVFPLAHEYQVKSLELACDTFLVQCLSQKYVNDACSSSCIYKRLPAICTCNLYKATEKCIHIISERLDDNDFESKYTLPDDITNAIRSKRLQILYTKYKDVFGHVKTTRALNQFLSTKAKEGDLFDKFMNDELTGDVIKLTIDCSKFYASKDIVIDGKRFVLSLGTDADGNKLLSLRDDNEIMIDRHFLYSIYIPNRMEGKEYIRPISHLYLQEIVAFDDSDILHDLDIDLLKKPEAGFIYKGNIEMHVYLFLLKTFNTMM